jgi:hypothetical protein
MPGASVKGFFKIEGSLPDGRRRILADWQPNLITNGGLERWGTGTPIVYCAVGNGTSTPQVTDSTLGANFVAQHNSVPSGGPGIRGSAPYYGYVTYVYRFTPPGTNKNISEIGVGWGTSGTNLWSRSLIKDINGTPVTITWLAAETLDVTYQARVYPFLNDVSYSTTLAGVTHTGVIRAALVTTSNDWQFYNAVMQFNKRADNTGGGLRGHNGSLGAITAGPGGTWFDFTTTTVPAYSALSYKRTATVTAGPTVGNLSGGISCLYGMTVGAWQMSVSPAIAKIADWTLTLNVETCTWGRAE